MAYNNYKKQACWDDLVNSLVGRRLNTGVGTIDYNWDDNTITCQPNGGITDENDRIGINYQKPHKAKEDTEFKFHLHWKQPDATSRTITYRYRIQKNGTAWSTAWANGSTDITSTVVFTYPGSGDFNQISNVVAIDMSGTSVSDTVQIQFTRSDSNAGNIDLVFSDVHYEIDTLGSKSEFIK